MNKCNENWADSIHESYSKKMPTISVIPYVGVKEQVNYEYNELTALCPVTELPDYYTIKISFIPDKLLPELKSLKMYFIAYRNMHFSHEHLASKIYEDLDNTFDPEKLFLKLKVNIRGGIETIIKIGDNL